MLAGLKAAFTSRKFMATVIGAIVVAAGSAFGLSEDQSLKIVGLICTYVLGQSAADVGKESKRIEVQAAAEVDAAVAGKSPAEAAAALNG
jgi:hypothetical protein